LVRYDVIYQFPENYDVTSILSNQQLKTLLNKFYSNSDKFASERYNSGRYQFGYEFDKKGRIYPAYKFNLFCEFSNKPVKFNRNKNPGSTDDNFCANLFDG